MQTLTRRRTMTLAAIALLGVAGGLAYVFATCAGTACDVRASTAAVGQRPAKPVDDDVAALGRVTPSSEIINIAAGAPDVLAALTVERGSRVTKGQVLGYLQGYAEDVARRDELSAELVESRAKLATETALDESRVADAEVRLRQIDEVTPLQITAQEATIAGIEVALANDQDILESTHTLATQNFASRRSYENQRAVVAKEGNDLSAARAHLNELRQKLVLDHLEGVTQVQLARAALARAKADFPIESLSKQIALTDVLAQEKTLHAPIDGAILNILIWPGEQVGNNPILVMGNTQAMWVVAEVYETDITRVRVGQSATITSRVFSHPLTGKVVSIGHMIFKNDVLNTDPAARVDARIVEVRIALDEPDVVADLTNLTVDVLIHGSTDPATAHLARAATP